MRRLSLLCLTLVVMISAVVSPAAESEGGSLRLFRLHYENSDGERGVTLFEYDHRGLIHEALWQLVDGSRNSINFYTYDEAGHMVKKYREFSDGKTSVQHFKYDENLRLVYEDFRRSDGVKGDTRYVYDKEGRRIKADCRGLNGWFHGVVVYKHDDENMLTGADLEREERKIGTIEYDYGDHGKLVKEKWNLPGKWSQTFTYEYDIYPGESGTTYTSANVFINHATGYRIVNENYNYSNKTGGPSFYKYKGKKLIRKIFKRADGLRTVTHFFYDGDGNLVKSLRRYADGNSAIFTYTYNTAGKLLNRTSIHPGGATAQESYRYDGLGRLVRAVWQNFDGWLTGTITFEHDKRGYPETGRFVGSGEKRFTAEISFAYDRNGNLNTIHWEFSFKGSQTYTFKYKKWED